MGERHAKSGVVSASVLIVGNPALPLKGFDVAIKALAAVNRVLPIQLTWVCQTQPTAASVPALVGSGLTIDLYVNPSQVQTLVRANHTPQLSLLHPSLFCL